MPADHSKGGSLADEHYSSRSPACFHMVLYLPLHFAKIV